MDKEGPMSNFFRSVPIWLCNIVHNSICSNCSNKIRKEDIVGVAVREMQDNVCTIFVEHVCSHCRFEARTNFGAFKNGSIAEMCRILVNETNKQKRCQNAAAIEKESVHISEPIGKKEAQDFVKQMNSSESFEDFLKMINADKFALGPGNES